MTHRTDSTRTFISAIYNYHTTNDTVASLAFQYTLPSLALLPCDDQLVPRQACLLTIALFICCFTMPNPIEVLAAPSLMPSQSLKLLGKWSASHSTPLSPPIKSNTSIKLLPTLHPSTPSPTKPATLYNTAAGIDEDGASALSLPESKFLLEPQRNSATSVKALSVSVASPTLTAAQPTATPDAITSPSSSSPNSSLSDSISHLSTPPALPARPSSPPAPLSSLSLSTLSSVSLSHRQRWRPHPQLFRVEEETHETEDEHWQRLCQQYSMTACFHYVQTSLCNSPQAARPPPPTLASLLSPTFVSCMTTGYKCTVVRQLPRLSTTCHLSVEWRTDRPMLIFGSQVLPLTAVYAVTTPSSPSSNSSPTPSSTTPLTLHLHLPLRLLQLTFQTPHEHTFFQTQFTRLIHHTTNTLSPVANLTYEPTSFLQLAQSGQPARRYLKRGGSDVVAECGVVSVDLSKGEVRWAGDGKEQVEAEGKRGSWMKRLWSGGRREERRQCVMSLLDDVRAVMAGKHTKVWMRTDQQRKQEGQTALSEQQCWSIVSDECTMDVEMADGRNVWVRGLLDLIDVLREARAEEERVKSHRRAKSAAKLNTAKQPKVLQPVEVQSTLPQRNSLTLPLPASTGTTTSSAHHGSFRAKRAEMAAKRAEQQAAVQRQQEAESQKSGMISLGSSSSRRGSGSVSLGGWLGGGSSGSSSEGSECDESGVDDWSDFDMSVVVTRPRSTSEAAPLPKPMARQ